jgi:hypothetical protein
MMPYLRILLNGIDQTRLNNFESFWVIESGLKKTQKGAKRLKTTAATLASIFIYRLSTLIYKLFGSILEVDFRVMFILDLNTF